MNRLVRAGVCGIAAGSAMFAVGAGLDAGLDDGAHMPFNRYGIEDSDNLDEARDVLASLELQYQQNSITTDESYGNITQNIPESCFSALDVYIGFVSEDQAVRELVTEPDKPCGDSARRIRTYYRDFSYAEERSAAIYSEDQTKLEAAQSIVDDYEEAIRDDKNFSGAILLGACGLIVGVLVGATHKKRQRADS